MNSEGFRRFTLPTKDLYYYYKFAAPRPGKISEASSGKLKSVHPEATGCVFAHPTKVYAYNAQFVHNPLNCIVHPCCEPFCITGV